MIVIIIEIKYIIKYATISGTGFILCTVQSTVIFFIIRHQSYRIIIAYLLDGIKNDVKLPRQC